MDKQKKTAAELEDIVKQRIGAGDFKVAVHHNPEVGWHATILRAPGGGGSPLPSHGRHDHGRAEPALRANRIKPVRPRLQLGGPRDQVDLIC
jgi:hypothetical protein